MTSLKDLIGTEIVALVPALNPKMWSKLKLLNVEAAGIWVEDRKFLEQALRYAGITASPKTTVFFLPFSQIVYVLGSEDVPFLSNEALR